MILIPDALASKSKTVFLCFPNTGNNSMIEFYDPKFDIPPQFWFSPFFPISQDVEISSDQKFIRIFLKLVLNFSSLINLLLDVHIQINIISLNL